MMLLHRLFQNGVVAPPHVTPRMEDNPVRADLMGQIHVALQRLYAHLHVLGLRGA